VSEEKLGYLTSLVPVSSHNMAMEWIVCQWGQENSELPGFVSVFERLGA